MKIRFLYFGKRWFAKKNNEASIEILFAQKQKIYPIFLQAYLNFRSKGLLYTCISTYYNYAHISMIIFSLNLYDLTIFLLDYFVVVEVYIGPRDGFHQSCRQEFHYSCRIEGIPNGRKSHRPLKFIGTVCGIFRPEAIDPLVQSSHHLADGTRSTGGGYMLHSG